MTLLKLKKYTIKINCDWKRPFWPFGQKSGVTLCTYVPERERVSI